MIEISEEKLFSLIGELYIENKVLNEKNSSFFEEVLNLKKEITELSSANESLSKSLENKTNENNNNVSHFQAYIQELEKTNQELRTLLAEPEEKQPQNKKDKKK